ncbi:Glutathione peroxidase [Artemisia annua]|uniref:Glutathione peroxidase n=1 Tax=Artemisia annua TaxID=35608 RepID=A0A2U1KNV5_ARTAN|nr:Glutathione peroxidase [Artemisia annua]
MRQRLFIYEVIVVRSLVSTWYQEPGNQIFCRRMFFDVVIEPIPIVSPITPEPPSEPTTSETPPVYTHSETVTTTETPSVTVSEATPTVTQPPSTTTQSSSEPTVVLPANVRPTRNQYAMGGSSSVPQKSIHEFTVKDSKGKEVDLSIYKGKVVLLI